MNFLSIEKLNELFEPDFDAGILYHKPKKHGDLNNHIDVKRWNTKFANKKVGYISSKGYIVVQYKGRKIPVHRIIWAMYYKAWPISKIDHKNRNKLDNRIENLRLASSAENGINTSIFKSNTSGYKGVSWQKLKNMWESRIMFNGKTHVLGYYSSKEEAHKVYCMKCIELYGDFAPKEIKEFATREDIVVIEYKKIRK